MIETGKDQAPSICINGKLDLLFLKIIDKYQGSRGDNRN